MRSVLEFAQFGQSRLHQNLSQEPFTLLIPPLDRAYEAAKTKVPLQRDAEVLRLFLLCHRSFLLASVLIAEGHPEDSAPVTRRAIEMVKLAVAFVHDPGNVERWTQKEARSSRWDARLEENKPRRLQIKLEMPADNRLLNALGRWEGIYSDAGVHLTPEYLGSFPLELRPNQIFLSYFVNDQNHIARLMRSCAATHFLILQLFNETFGGAFQTSKEWCDAMNEVIERGEGVYAGPNETAGPEEPAKE